MFYMFMFSYGVVVYGFQEFSNDGVTQVPLRGGRKFAKLWRTLFERVYIINNIHIQMCILWFILQRCR
jgi:hypothetical protein